MNPELFHLEAGANKLHQLIGPHFGKLDNLLSHSSVFQDQYVKCNTQSFLLLKLFFFQFFNFNLQKIGN